MKCCYLAGPMRGYSQYNFPAFFAAAASLRVRGYAVWSPAENDVHEDGFDPAKDQAQPMRHYMKRDLPAVLDADFVAVLPGWERSQGATLEVTVARACGIPVLDAETLAEVPPLKSDCWTPVHLSLPANADHVLVATDLYRYPREAIRTARGWLIEGNEWYDDDTDGRVTHWQPLPENPNSEHSKPRTETP